MQAIDKKKKIINNKNGVRNRWQIEIIFLTLISNFEKGEKREICDSMYLCKKSKFYCKMFIALRFLI